MESGTMSMVATQPVSLFATRSSSADVVTSTTASSLPMLLICDIEVPNEKWEVERILDSQRCHSKLTQASWQPCEKLMSCADLVHDSYGQEI